MKRRTNFDLYLEEQLKDPDFAERFKKAGESWDAALQIGSLRKVSGLSRKGSRRSVCWVRDSEETKKTDG